MDKVNANVTYLIPLKEYLPRQGVSARDVFDAAGVDMAILAHPGHFVPVADICRVFDVASDMTGDPVFGIHYGEAYPRGASGLHGQFMLSAPSVGDMLKVAAVYGELMISPVTNGFIEDADETTFYYAIPGVGGGQTYARFGAFLQVTLLTPHPKRGWRILVPVTSDVHSQVPDRQHQERVRTCIWQEHHV